MWLQIHTYLEEQDTNKGLREEVGFDEDACIAQWVATVVAGMMKLP